MDAPARFREIIAQGRTTTAEALEIFDALPGVEIETIFGRWRGAGFETGHAMDGLLELFGWYGKEFIDADTVHPLLFQASDGSVFKVDPKKMPVSLTMKIPVPRSRAVRIAFLASRPLLEIEEPRARVRSLVHRGKPSASMIYDDLPIIDVFREVDRDTLLGLMDLRGLEQPFFFALRRET